MTDRGHLSMTVTVHDHDGTEGEAAFEQYVHDMFQMYRDVDVTVELEASGDD